VLGSGETAVFPITALNAITREVASRWGPANIIETRNPLLFLPEPVEPTRGVPEIPIHGHQSPLSLPPSPHSLPEFFPKLLWIKRQHHVKTAFLETFQPSFHLPLRAVFDGMVIWCHRSA
jgi:hypothetical protein